MSMKIVAAIFIVLMQSWQALAADQVTLTGPAAHLYRQAQSGRWFADAAKLNPDILPTSDGQSFIVVWKAAGKEPTRWIVSLHGTRGFATDDLAIWYPHLKNRDVGLVAVQWWIGPHDTPKSYYNEYERGRLAIDLINGSPLLREWVEDAAATAADLDALARPDEAAWREAREAVLLYR